VLQFSTIQDAVIGLAGLSAQPEDYLDTWFTACSIHCTILWAHTCPFADKSWVTHFPQYATGLLEELMDYKLIVCAELTCLGGTWDTLVLTDILQALDSAGDIFTHHRDLEHWSDEFRSCLLACLAMEWHGWFGPRVETYMLLLLIEVAYDELAPLPLPPPSCSPSPSPDGEAVPLHRLRHGHSLTCRRGCSVSTVEGPASNHGHLHSHGRGCGHSWSSVCTM
jgi:hypothetical protein